MIYFHEAEEPIILPEGPELDFKNIDDMRYYIEQVSFDTEKELAFLEMHDMKVNTLKIGVFTEGFFSNVWEKIKALFKKIWNACVNGWHKLTNWITGIFKRSPEEDKTLKECVEMAKKYIFKAFHAKQLTDIKNDIESEFKKSEKDSTTARVKAGITMGMILKSIEEAKKREEKAKVKHNINSDSFKEALKTLVDEADYTHPQDAVKFARELMGDWYSAFDKQIDDKLSTRIKDVVKGLVDVKKEYDDKEKEVKDEFEKHDKGEEFKVDQDDAKNRLAKARDIIVSKIKRHALYNDKDNAHTLLWRLDSIEFSIDMKTEQALKGFIKETFEMVNKMFGFYEKKLEMVQANEKLKNDTDLVNAYKDTLEVLKSINAYLMFAMKKTGNTEYELNKYATQLRTEGKDKASVYKVRAKE